MESLDKVNNKGKKYRGDRKVSLKKVYMSMINSLVGLRKSYSTEQSLSIHFGMSILVLGLGIFFKINRYEWIFSILLMGLIVCIELLNTAIEANVDLATDKVHPLARNAKDIGSAATFMMSMFALIGEILLFYPYILELFR
ncbi:MAG: diacylglycerol kinase [Bacilli bacterium]|nr:diacylglycerol kinase [Bacilli bacterium]